MKKNLIICILVSLIVLSNGLNYYLMHKKNNTKCTENIPLQFNGSLILVPVSKHQMNGFDEIKEEDLAYIKLPKDYAESLEIIADKNQLIDKQIDLFTEIEEYSFFYLDMLNN